MSFHSGKGCEIHPTARIDVKEGSLGPRSIIREGAIIEGNFVDIGAEAYLDVRARIGGGSCFDKLSMLCVGDFLHMGVDSHINTARPVGIGNEVGVGVGTKIFTHGAYLAITDGFPVQWAPVEIGDRVWLPNAWVNPGVTIGNDVVVAAMSLVNRDLPTGCLAGGVPVKVLKENAYPQIMTGVGVRQVVGDLFSYVNLGENHTAKFTPEDNIVIDNETVFAIHKRKIAGKATIFTEKFRNELRRNGIRFRYYPDGDRYIPW